MLFHDQWPEKKKYRATKTDMATMLKKKMVDNVPVTSMLKFETMYHKNTMPIATSVWAVVLIGAGRKKLMTVIKMKAIRGGSTTCTRYIIQFVYQAALWPKALPVHTLTDEAKGSMADSSAKANPTGIRSRAKTGKTRAAPAPVTENQ